MFAEADCGIGSSTAPGLAAAACDRAGSLDSNSIIIRPFQVFSIFSRLCSTVELNIIHGWRFLESLLSLSLLPFSARLSLPLSLSLSVISVKSMPPLLPFPSTQGFGQEPATSLRQIFPGSPKAILPGFPLGLYPLPMFQIIYRRIYLLYVVMDSFDMARSKETQHLTCTFPQLNSSLYCPCLVYFF